MAHQQYAVCVSSDSDAFLTILNFSANVNPLTSTILTLSPEFLFVFVFLIIPHLIFSYFILNPSNFAATCITRHRKATVISI